MWNDIPGQEIETRPAEELFENPQNPQSAEAIEALAETSLLTERQAEVYVRRVIDLELRESVADDLGISPSTLDDHLAAAKGAVAGAVQAKNIIDTYRNPPMPSACAECGASLGGRWAESEDGEPLCPDCAGVSDEAWDV